MKKRKKQRRPKVSKKEPKMVSVDRIGPEPEISLDELIRWFSDHQQQTDQLFGGGSVNVEDFELGLMKLGVPCRPSQLHTLTSNGTISYHHFIRKVPTLRTPEDFIKRRGAAEEENKSCLESQQQPNPGNHSSSFLRLNVRMIPFHAAAAHPGNFQVVLSSRSRVFALIRMVRDHVRIPTCSLEVFRSGVTTEEARLNPESSLEECGFEGGPETSPPEATVYYDYTLLFPDCPLLNCDHYFRSK